MLGNAKTIIITTTDTTNSQHFTFIKYLLFTTCYDTIHRITTS